MVGNDAHKDFNSLVTRKLSGELSSEELDYFQELLAGDPALRDQFEEYQKTWDSMEGVADQHAYDLDAEWEALHQQIPDFSKSRSILFYGYRIAAVLLVGLLFTFAWFYTTQWAGTKVMAAGSEPVEILLEDGSMVVLNSESKIRYRKSFTGNERRIRLTGEAWFDVARDTTRPFVIDAGTAIVEVLGTSFNVNAYRDNPSVEITVKSGVVALMAKQDIQDQIVLRAGNSGTYNNNNKELVLVPTSDPNNISWKTKELYFENATLGEVVDLLERVYHVEMEIGSRELSMCPITVTFRDQSLESVLSVIELTLDLDIVWQGGKIILEGEGCVE